MAVGDAEAVGVIVFDAVGVCEGVPVFDGVAPDESEDVPVCVGVCVADDVAFELRVQGGFDFEAEPEIVINLFDGVSEGIGGSVFVAEGCWSVEAETDRVKVGFSETVVQPVTVVVKVL